MAAYRLRPIATSSTPNGRLTKTRKRPMEREPVWNILGRRGREHYPRFTSRAALSRTGIQIVLSRKERRRVAAVLQIEGDDQSRRTLIMVMRKSQLLVLCVAALPCVAYAQTSSAPSADA